MTTPYAWSTDPFDDDMDAVMVFVSADVGPGEILYRTVSVQWPERLRGDWLRPGYHYANDVPEALAFAHELAGLLGFSRVVIILQDVGLWQPAWGKLAEVEGL